MSYFCGGSGQPGLPGHGGTGDPQHTARTGCSDFLWPAPVLATAPIISKLRAMILRIFFGIAFLLIGRKVSTFALFAVSYLVVVGQPGLPGHIGTGAPQHTATLNGC